MKKILSISISFIFPLLLLVPSVPLISDAQTKVSDQSKFQLLPCSGLDCDYNAAVRGFNNVVKFIIAMSIPIGTVMFAYAGFLYMRAGENPGNKEKAKHLFVNILIGFGLVLGAWLIVYTVVSKLTTIDGGTVGNTGKTVGEITQLKDAPNPNK